MPESVMGATLKRVEADLNMMILKLQTHFPLRVADWLTAGILLSWGIACLNIEPAVWSLPIYSGLRTFASQETWGTLSTVLGATRMIALFINGSMRRTPHIRALGAFFTVFIWLQLTLGMFVSATPTIAIAIYPWLCLADMYNVYRAAQDARESDYSISSRGNKGHAVNT